MNTPKTGGRKPIRVIAILATLLLATLEIGAIAQPGNTKLRVLFYGPTFWAGGIMDQFLINNAAVYEPVARDPQTGDLMYSTTASQVWTPGVGGSLDWSTKTLTDFQGFDLIVIDEGPGGAINDPAPWAGAINNRSVWSLAVNLAQTSGKRILIYCGDPEQDGSSEFVAKCLEAGAERTSGSPSGPGLVFFTAHIDASSPSPVDPNKKAIAHLLSSFGVFSAVDGDLCGTAYEVCSHPVNDCYDPFGTVARIASGWGIGFNNWPAAFVPVLARRSPPNLEAPPALLPGGLRGVATLLARGKWEQLTASPTYTSSASQALTVTVTYKQMPGGSALNGRSLRLRFVKGPSVNQTDLTSTTVNGIATFTVPAPGSLGEDQMIITDVTQAPVPPCAPKLGIRCFWVPASVSVSPVAGRTSTAEASATSAKFRFTRTGSLDSSMIVNVQFSGSATLGLDYHTVPPLFLSGDSHALLIDYGSATADLEIYAYPDTRREGTESVVWTVMPENYGTCSDPWSYAVGSPSQATVSILDDPADGWQIPTAWYLYDLGTLGGDQSWALGVSEAYFNTEPGVETGAIVGGSRWQPGNANPRAFCYGGTVENNILTGAIMALPSTGIVWSEAMGTEMFGAWIAGRYSPDGIQIRPFVYHWGDANLVQLPTLGGNAEAVAISWPLYPVGSGLNAYGDWRATAWNPNNGYAAIDLWTLALDSQGYSSYAYGVNNNGRVVGKSQGWFNGWHAFRTRLSSYGDFAPQPILWTDDLGTLSGSQDSEARGISDLDEVVGQSGGYAVLWSAVDYPLLQRLYASGGSGYCTAQAINNLGVVVGSRTSLPNGSPDAAVLWWNHNAPYSVDLSSLSLTIPGGGTWDLRLASAINDNNWIVGWGYKNGQPRAFMLKPQQLVE